jgi:hypothetical protein
MQPILQIHFRHAAIHIQIQQIHIGIKLLQPLLYASGYYVVGYAAEGLDAYYFVDAAAGVAGYFGGD